MRCAIKNVVLSLFVLLACPPAFPQVVEENGETMEFLGLRQWTIEQIRDSLKRVAPGEQLGYCAVPLKYKLHFPDVSVEYLTHPSDTNRSYIVVTVIEPQDSIYVNRQVCYPSPYNLPQEWREFQEQFGKNRYEREFALRYGFMNERELREQVKKTRLDTVALNRIRKSLAQLSVNVSKMVRLATESYDPETRQIAIMALSKCPENDSSWYALIKGLRDISDVNTGFASIVLTNFAENSKRRIDWRPAYSDLQFLFNGTNLFSYMDIMKVLACVGYSKEDFTAIFKSKHSRELLIAQLRAHHPIVRQRVVDFLKPLNLSFEGLTDEEKVSYLMGW